MEWKSYISKTYNRPYWFNNITRKSVWVKPPEVVEYEIIQKQYEEERKMKSQEESKRAEEDRAKREKEWHRLRILYEERFGDSPRRPQGSGYGDNGGYNMSIVNGNGMSWTIEGGSHWTKQDYLDEIQNYNQAMRDF